MFSTAFSSPPVPRAEATNSLYKGWDVRIDRLFFANGMREHSLLLIQMIF